MGYSDPYFRFFERLLFSPLRTLLLVLWRGKSFSSPSAWQGNSDEIPSFSTSPLKAGEVIWARCRWHGWMSRHTVWSLEKGLADQVVSVHWHIALVCGHFPLSSLSYLVFSRKCLCSVSGWVRCPSNSFYFVYQRCVLFCSCHREGCWRNSPSYLASDAILLYICFYGGNLEVRKVIRKPC